MDIDCSFRLCNLIFSQISGFWVVGLNATENWMLKFLTSGESSVNPNVSGFPVVKYSWTFIMGYPFIVGC